jgi:two-component system sensor histidine kinase KdpD
MVYLLGVVIVAARYERGPATACALVGALAFDFFFVPPLFTLRIDDTQYVITGFALLVVGIVISTLASRARAATRAALLAQEEQLRNSLLASLSHDLRTPLAVIAGSASSLRDERSRLSQAEQDQLLETLYEEAQQVSLTVSDLLEMTRLHAGRVELDRQWYPAEELVGAALERCKRQLAQHRVQTRLDPQLPLLHVDGVLIEKLLVNLIENAAKYAPPDTLITLVGESGPRTVLLRVEDEGPGLPPGTEERVFEKFYRADRESAVTGSGLGLSICRAIAQMHGGSITAANRQGAGAVFTLSLPAKPAPRTELP